HKGFPLGVKELENGLVRPDICLLPDVRQDPAQNLRCDHRGQEIIEHDPLVMEAHFPLHLLETPAGIGFSDSIMKPEKEALKLRNDYVLVVSGVADDRAASVFLWIVDLASGKVSSFRIGGRAGKRSAQDEIHAVFEEVGLVIGSSTVD